MGTRLAPSPGYAYVCLRPPGINMQRGAGQVEYRGSFPALHAIPSRAHLFHPFFVPSRLPSFGGSTVRAESLSAAGQTYARSAGNLALPSDWSNSVLII